MHVAQDETESGELVDHVLLGPPGRIVLQHARGLPPPEEARGHPTALRQGHRRHVNLVDVQPGPPRSRPDAAGVQHLQQPLQISHPGYQQRPQQSARHRPPIPPLPSFLPLPSFPSFPSFPSLPPLHRNEIVNEAERPRAGKCEERSNPQVERDGGRNGRQPREHRHDDVAEVVVRNGKARQPRIVRRERLGAQDGAQERNLHPLLAARRLNPWHICSYHAPASEG